MITTFKRPTTMADALMKVAAKIADKTGVKLGTEAVDPRMPWVARRVLLDDRDRFVVTEKSGCWYQ